MFKFNNLRHFSTKFYRPDVVEQLPWKLGNKSNLLKSHSLTLPYEVEGF